MQVLTSILNGLNIVNTIFVILMLFTETGNTLIRKNWARLSIAIYIISGLLLQIVLRGYLGIVNFVTKFLLLLLIFWILLLGRKRAFELCIGIFILSAVLLGLGISRVYNTAFEFGLLVTLVCIAVFVLPEKVR